MNNSPPEMKSDEFMDNAYEQINRDISKLLFEMEKEKQKGIDNKDDFCQKFFDDDEQDKNIIYNNQMNNISFHNSNNNLIDIKMNNNDNYYSNNNFLMDNYSNNNNLLFNNQALRNNNTINTNNIFNNNKIIIPNNNNQINIPNNNSPYYNFNIINNNNNNINSNDDKNKLLLNQAITERGSTGLFNIDTSDNVININNIIKNKDKRTTVIIRNIPNRYTISLLLIELSTNFANKFDIIYLPQDKVNDCNLGYGFINFINPLHLILFYEEFMGKKWNFSNSQKRCFLAYSNYQGKKDLINYMLKKIGGKKFNNHKIMNEKIRKCFYINNNNINAPLEIPIKYQIKFENYHPFSIYYKKSDKILIVETFKK